MFGLQHGYGALLLKSKLKSLSAVTALSIRISSPQPQYVAQRLWYCHLTRPIKEESFSVCYLRENCGFSLERAISTAKRVRFENSQRPEACFTFFRSYGFSDPQICTIFRKVPALLLFDPQKNILPKLEFFESKGFSTSDIVYMVSYAPWFLERSLEKLIIPAFDLVMELCQSDVKKALKTVKTSAHVVFTNRLWQNVQFLIDNGVSKPNVVRSLQLCPLMLSLRSNNFKETVDQVKDLGIETSKANFVLALVSKIGMSKSNWDSKEEIYKKWGWSTEEFVSAFKANPQLMRNSTHKIEAVMDYWVNQLGWDASILAKGSAVIGYSMERRIKPRASVLQYLLSKSLIHKKAGLIAPFLVNEKLFLQRYVECYREETPQLLKLYKDNLNISH